MSQPTLEIRNPRGVRSLTVGSQPVTIGRLTSNLLIVDDTQASRQHCVIESTSMGLTLRDLGSRNGTILNGRKVTTEALRDGDVITIGQTTIKLADPAHPRQPEPGGAHLDPVSLDALAEEDVEELSDADAVEDLSEGDLIDEFADDDLPSLPSVPDDESLISVDISGDREVPSMGTPSMIDVGEGTGDFMASLQAIVDALPEPYVSEKDIALINTRGQVVHAAGQGKQTTGRVDAVETMRLILLICLRNRGTDIHFEPKQDQYMVRIRVDGVMVEVVKVDPQMGVRLNALVKVLSDIDIAQRNTVQEGHFAASAPTIENGKRLNQTHRIDYRVSFAPSMHGQKLVVRVLDTTNAPLKLNNLALPEWMRETIGNAIQQEAGMILVTGPTGSGKTTSLYALIRTLNVSQLNVTTIEDPVEIELPGVTQIPVDESAGKSFSALLRSLLRQDPDVIMVGEVRDPETARIAMQAAITGHLVFSTLHTKDSIGSVFRLLDLGVEPYLVAQALNVVLAQRLARQLCPYCKRPTKPTPQQQAKFETTVGPLERIFVPHGCPRCLNTGFAGRRGFFELLFANDKLRDAILNNLSLEGLQKAMVGTPYKRLEHSGHLLIAEGVTSFDEIDRSVVR